jgi:hypothetical protein
MMMDTHRFESVRREHGACICGRKRRGMGAVRKNVINSGRAVFARAVGCMEMATFSASIRLLGRFFP